MKSTQNHGQATRDTSYKRILRSTSIIGGASVINIIIGLIRMKVAALLLGPAGVGLIGLMQSLIATGSVVASLGLGPAGTRQIAKATAEGDATQVTSTRRALFWGTLLLSLGGGGVFWVLRNVLAERVFGNPTLADTVGWLAIGISLTVASGSQVALLNGLQRIGDLARVTIGTALFSTVLGVATILIWRDRGILIFVLISPIASFLLGHWYVANLPRLKGGATPFRVILTECKTLAQLGMALMIAGVLWSIGHLVVRTYIQSELGTNSLGHFMAAWTIGTTYLGVVLSALGTDYLPRLSAVINDPDQANRVINEQSEVGLLLAGPLLLAMLGLAPWVIDSLYSKDFLAGVELLKWQVLADVLKLIIWPLSYSILASGRGRTYLLTESLAVAIFVGLTWWFLPIFGIKAAGISFLVIFIFLLPINYCFAWRQTRFRWSLNVLFHAAVLAIASLGVFLAGSWSIWLGAGVGGASALIFLLYGLAQLGHMAELTGRLGRLSGSIKRLMMLIGVWRD